MGLCPFSEKNSEGEKLQTPTLRCREKNAANVLLTFLSFSFSLSPYFWLLAMRQSDIINKREKVVRRDAVLPTFFCPRRTKKGIFCFSSLCVSSLEIACLLAFPLPPPFCRNLNLRTTAAAAAAAAAATVRVYEGGRPSLYPGKLMVGTTKHTWPDQLKSVQEEKNFCS